MIHRLPPCLRAACLGALLSLVARAADDAKKIEPSPPTEPAQVSGAPAVGLERVEVTGSRIRGLLGEATPNAVITYSRAELETMGAQTLPDLARYIPQLDMQGEFDPETQGNFGSQFRGTSTVFNDLRGLGANYSLVLVDGRRLPRAQQYNGFDSQDLNGIPLSAVERIEILPAGASAVYGTDAVTGVVNFILKKNYDATELNLSYRNTWHTDTALRTARFGYGFARKNFSLLVNLEWSQTNSLAPRDRWWNASADFRPYGGTDMRSPVPDGPGVVRSTTGANLPGLNSPVAAIPANSDGRNLTIADFANSGPIPGPTDTLKYVDNATTSNASYSLRTEYEWHPWLKLFASGRWGEKRTYRPGDYTLPLIGAGVVPRGEAIGTVTLPAGYPGNPFGVPIIVQKVFWDLIPYLAAHETSINPNVEAGLRGDLPHGWAYEAYVRDSWIDQHQFGGLSLASTSGVTPRFLAAINNPDPNLRPILLHNSLRFSPNSAAVMNSLFEKRPITNTTDTWEYGARADGPLYSLRSGDVRASASVTRIENYIDTRFVPTDTSQASAVSQSVNGHSTEYSLQLEVPIAGKDRRFAWVHDLRLNATYGGSHQSLPHGSSDVKDLSVIYQPLAWLTLRANRTESYKLPTIYEALQPATTGSVFFGLLGPLLPSLYGVLDPLRGNTPVLYTISALSGGNPDLKPQNGRTRGASIEIAVPFVKELKFSAVYSDTDIDNQIVFGSLNYQSIFSFFPNRLTRAPLTAADTAAGYTGGSVTFIDARNLNLARTRTANLDLSAEYRQPLGRWGTLTVSVRGTEPLQNYSVPVPGAQRSDVNATRYDRYTGTVGWTRSAWAAGSAVRYTGRFLNSTQTIPSYTQTDAWCSYDFGTNPNSFASGRRQFLRNLKVTVRGLDIFAHDPQFQRSNGYIIGRGNPYQAQYQIDVRKTF